MPVTSGKNPVFTVRPGNINEDSINRSRGEDIMPRKNQIIAVVIKHYATGLYRTCISLDRDNILHLSTHRDERSANEAINQFWRAYDEGRLKGPEDLAGLISAPGADQPPHTPASAPVPVFTPLAA